MKRFDRQRQQQIAWALLIVAMIVYAVVMSYQSVMRYDTFKATAFDLGNMDQVLWNTIHGRWFQFTNQGIDWYGPPTRLAVHFEPIILPLSLLYVFYADPRILLVFQTLAIVSGALPTFLLARKHLSEWPLLPPLLAIAYLASPALIGLNIFDFHPLSLATPLLLYAVLALEYRRYGWFLLACVLAAACKEDVPLSIALLGVLVIRKYKLPRLGTTLIVGGLLWSLVAFRVIIPHFYPGVSSNNFWYRYEILGSSPGEAIVNVLLHPWLLFTTFFTLDRFYYLAGLFRSAGFLSLLAPEWLLPALPILAENLLSTDPLVYSGVYHYNAVIIPFVMVGAIFGTRNLIATWRLWRGEAIEAKDVSVESPDPHLNVAGGLLWCLRLSQHVVAPLVGARQRLKQVRPFVSVATVLQRGFVVGIRWLSIQWQRLSERLIPLAQKTAVSRLHWVALIWIIAMASMNYAIAFSSLSSFWADHALGSREQHIQQLLAMIPPNASVSASSNLNPHVSERQLLAVFPSITTASHDTTDSTVQYIVVDLNAVFPEDRVSIDNELNHLQHSGQYVELLRAEGVVLLVRRSTTG